MFLSCAALMAGEAHGVASVMGAVMQAEIAGKAGADQKGQTKHEGQDTSDEALG